MKNFILAICLCGLFCACNAESGADGADDQDSSPKAAEKSERSAKKWLIAVDGLPEKSGNVITAVTMDGNGNYALARSGFTASITFSQDEPTSMMMINFNTEAVRCANKEGASAVRDGDRAVITGEVLCYPRDGSFDDAQPAAIEGYFELKK